MNNKLKETFDNIHAEEELKTKTKAFLSKKTQNYRKNVRRASVYKRLVPVAVCFLFVLIGLSGYRIYFTPMSVISIDVNPSLELGINRFDRVVSVKGFNDAGSRLAESLNIRFMNYTEALNKLLDSDDILDYLSRDEYLSIAVIGSDETQREEMLSNIESCTEGHKNTHCHSIDSDDVEGAHDVGFSCGKYNAFLELQALDPDITIEEVQGMTMREIQEMIDELTGENSSETQNGHGNSSNKHKRNKEGHGGSRGGHSSGHDD